MLHYETGTVASTLLVLRNLDASNVTGIMRKVVGGSITFGPIWMGCDIAAHIATPSTTVRGLVNLTAIAAARCEST